MTPVDQRLLRQFGKKLATAKGFLRPLGDSAFGLFRHGQKTSKPSAVIGDRHVRAWQKADLVEAEGERLVLSATGRAWLRRHFANGSFAAQHQHVGPSSGNKTVMQNQTTPLQWLRARPSGAGMGLQEAEFDAGQRLSHDYDRAQYQPRQTMNWQRPVFVDGLNSQNGPDPSQTTLDARKRLDAALAYIGPGLADVAIAVCCAEVGLEQCERGFQLPQRSAKIMLKLALMRLSVHYGFQSAAAAAASFRMR